MSGFRTIVRFLLARRHRSKTPTGIVPLSQIHSAVVFRDPKEPSPDRDFRRFFEPLGIRYRVISEFDREVRTDEDLFISITAETTVSERYAAMSSGARLKVGRRQIGKDVYDIVVSNPGDTFKGQAVAFAAICEILRRVE